MTERVIRIVLDADDLKRGLDQVKGKLKDTDKAAKNTGESMRALKQIAGGLLAALGIRELIKYADQWTTIGNRIKLVTDGTEEYNTVQDRLVGLAQRTRTDLNATAELYARVARSTETLGASQNEVLRFTEATNQALQISGATAQEASAGVIQFAQGLASGALRGDELRSVMEQMPRLAQAISEQMGITIGELRILGEEGKLTSKAIFEAVLRAAPELQREFDVITPTISQAITTVKNFATTVIGSFNEAAGITEGLVEIFALTDDQTVKLGRTVREMALNFREFIEVATIAIVGFAEKLVPRLTVAVNEFVKITAVLTGDEERFIAAFQDQDKAFAAIDGVTDRLNAEFDAIIRNNEARRAALEQRDADLDRERGQGGAGGTIDPEALKAAEALAKSQAQLLEGLQTQEAALALSAATGIEYADALLQIKINALAVGDAGEAFRFDAEETATEIRRLTAELKAKADAEQAAKDRQEEAIQITMDARTETELLAAEVARLQGFLDDGLISQETFDRSVENLTELDDGLQDFFRRARENSQDILAGFLESGLQDIDEFARGFSEMLLKLASQALAAGIFEKILGSADGGGGFDFAGFFGGLFGGRQFGGGVQGGQAVSVGEGGRFGQEVFVPNQSGNVVPLGGAGGGAAPNVNVPVSIVNTIDPSQITGAFQTGEGDQVLLNRIGVKRNAFRRALGL